MIERLIHKIKIRQAELKESMCAGTPTTFEWYQRMVGEYNGLESALTLIDSLLEEDEDQDR